MQIAGDRESPCPQLLLHILSRRADTSKVPGTGSLSGCHKSG